jgi:4'-phosphopantetheinyl transferase
VLTLRRDEVHVWRAELALDPADFIKLQETLAPDERERAARFRFLKDRQRFIAARGVLREVLARYLNQDPARLEFCYGPSGKPTLAAGMGAGELRFNLSHSHGLALYAITRRREIGVDLEYVRPQLAEEQIAERFFSRHEVEALRALPASIQPEAFFHCWTRKEAYIKARGEGLAVPLDSFDVSLAPGEPPALLSVRSDPREAARWSLETLSPGSGYVGAVAAEGSDWSIRLWRWEPPVE